MLLDKVSCRYRRISCCFWLGVTKVKIVKVGLVFITECYVKSQKAESFQSVRNFSQDLSVNEFRSRLPSRCCRAIKLVGFIQRSVKTIESRRPFKVSGSRRRVLSRDQQGLRLRSLADG